MLSFYRPRIAQPIVSRPLGYLGLSFLIAAVRSWSIRPGTLVMNLSSCSDVMCSRLYFSAEFSRLLGTVVSWGRSPGDGRDGLLGTDGMFTSTDVTAIIT
jgi:hypothetical protein